MWPEAAWSKTLKRGALHLLSFTQNAESLHSHQLLLSILEYSGATIYHVPTTQTSKYVLQTGEILAAGAGQDGRASYSETDLVVNDTVKVLEAISSCQTSLTMKIEEVKVDISLIQQDLQKL